MSTQTGSYIYTGNALTRTDNRNAFTFRIAQPTNSNTNVKSFQFYGSYVNSIGGWSSANYAGIDNSGFTVSSLALYNTGGNLSTGTALLYGVR
jgi:hypothetical protein